MILVPTIDKPLSGTFVAVRDTYINLTIKRHTKMKVCIKDVGCEVVDPVKWKETGKRIEKVFLFKNMTMIFFGNTVHVQDIKETPKPIEEVKTYEAIMGMPEHYRKIWKEKLGIRSAHTDAKIIPLTNVNT